jgi:hypothetical protein
MQVTNAAQAFRHTGWQSTRERVYWVLKDAIRHNPAGFIENGPAKTRADNFAACGAHANVYQNPEKPDEYRVSGSCCHDRFCLPCAQARSRAISMAVCNHLNGSRARFLTLTVKADALPLGGAIKKLYTAFKELRRNRIWKDRVTGGVAFLEIKYNPETRNWHPHLHCLIQGRYLPHSDLSHAWHRITGDSYIVHIALVENDLTAHRYITKYSSKPLNSTYSHDHNLLAEAITALHRVRMCMTFGEWRGLKLTPEPDAQAWIKVASLLEVLNAAANGEPWATEISQALEADRITGAEQYLHEHPPPPPIPEPPHYEQHRLFAEPQDRLACFRV